MFKFWQNVALVVAVVILVIAFLLHLYGNSWDTSSIKKIDSLLQGLISAMLFLILVFYFI